MKKFSRVLMLLLLALAESSQAQTPTDRTPISGSIYYICSATITAPNGTQITPASMRMIAHSSGSVLTALYSLSELPRKTPETRRLFRSLPAEIRALRFGVSRIHRGDETLGTYFQADWGRRLRNGQPEHRFYEEFEATTITVQIEAAAHRLEFLCDVESTL